MVYKFEIYILSRFQINISSDSEVIQIEGEREYMSQKDKSIEELIHMLDDKHAEARQFAVQELIRYGKEVVDPLLQAAQNTLTNRFDAARIFGQVRDTRAVGLLIEWLDTDNFFLTQEAAKALGWLGDSRAINPLIDVFRHEWDDTETMTTWQTAAKALATIGQSALGSLLSALHDQNEAVRYWVADTLGQLADTQAVDALIETLHDSESSVRAMAAKALGNIGGRQATHALSKLLEDNDWYVRSSAINALGQIKEPSLFDILKKAMKDPEPKVRRAVATNMKYLPSSIAMNLLVEMLQDPIGEVRNSVILALAKVGDESVLPQLKQIQRMDIGYAGANSVKDAATYAIQQIQARSRSK